MKARPILMSTPMVRALLDGGKTQTRRIIKPAPGAEGSEICLVRSTVSDEQQIVWRGELRCPYGNTGDLLWVREAGWISNNGTQAMGFIPSAGNTPSPSGYKSPNGTPYKRCVSIHMPRWANRITLEIISVRAERLQEIEYADVIEEGTQQDPDKPWMDIAAPAEYRRREAVEAYKTLWESINGAGSWDSNPWVWVISFKPHQLNVDEFLEQHAA